MEKPTESTEIGVTASELLEEYKARVDVLTHENIFLRAYVKRIEKKLEEAKSKKEKSK